MLRKQPMHNNPREPMFQGPLAHALRALFAHEHRPDPWPEEVDREIRRPDAQPLCLRCLSPQERIPQRWFCPHCAYPVGHYNILMPYLDIFVIGALVREGVIGQPEKSKFRIFSAFVFSVMEYAMFAPLYWLWMIRKALGRPICADVRPPPVVDGESLEPVTTNTSQHSPL
jgi:hypothetical protein